MFGPRDQLVVSELPLGLLEKPNLMSELPHPRRVTRAVTMKLLNLLMKQSVVFAQLRYGAVQLRVLGRTTGLVGEDCSLAINIVGLRSDLFERRGRSRLRHFQSAEQVLDGGIAIGLVDPRRRSLCALETKPSVVCKA